jgi:cell division protein FtsI (penicillin-binding protein 3)
MPQIHSTRRLHYLLWLLLGWAGVVFARLVWLQVIDHDELARLAQQQQQRSKEIPALRGTILDRTGQPLAKSMPAESVCVNPQKISDPGMAADLLSRILDLDRRKVLEKIEAAELRGSGFLWIKRKVAAEEAERLRSLKLDWVEFRPETLRFYPHRSLAAHVVGSMGITNAEDTVERGSAGIEASFDEELAGRPGLTRVFTDVKQNPYDAVETRKPEAGANITLTIDPNLQFDAEKELAKAVASSGAKTGSIVVLNPYNGEVLAMANYPTFDPNNAPTPEEPEGARSNLAITTPFEPGSVYKIITVASGLETTRLRPDSIINCGNGTINLFGRIFHDHSRYWSLSMQQVFEKSSNIGAIQIGLKVGERQLYNYSRNFGVGRKTGIELPGESAGMLRRVKDWTPSSIGSVAMGHEISTTSLQLAVAGAVIANGGMLVKPQIVLARQRAGGPAERINPEKPVRVVAPETAIIMRQMMEGVVLRGTGRGFANLKGYTSGGKTGSAQVFDLKARVYTHKYNASFVGFAPVVNPQIVIAVTLNNTSGGSTGYGGPVAGPVFRDVATSALRMLDVPKDLPDTVISAARGITEINDLAIAGLGDGPVAENSFDAHDADTVRSPSTNAHNADDVHSRSVSSVTQPPAPADVSSDASDAGRRPFLAAVATGPRVPDFRGMTLRAVLEESSARSLPVETFGAPETGLVRNQDPPAGAVLPLGVRVRVQFAK